MKKSGKMLQYIMWLVLLAGTVVFVTPYLIMITNSFISFNFSLPYPPKLFPDKIDFSAYRHIIYEMDILYSFKNSVIVTALTTIFIIALSTMSAYAFARIKFPGREIIFKIYLFTLKLPGFFSIIPQFIILKNIRLPGLENGLTGSFAGLILLYLSTGICGNTFFMRSFFESLPKEYEESVFVDGGSHMVVFSKIMFPLVKPAVGTMAIFTIQGIWEEYFTARVVLMTNNKLMTMPLVLQRLNGEHSTRFEWVFAASILMQIPIIVLFVIFQKKFVVGGLTAGSIKG